jgi:hypothetical protein
MSIIFFSIFPPPFTWQKKRKEGGIERTGKNITSRIGEPANSRQYPSNHQASFSKVVSPLFRIAGYAQVAGQGIQDRGVINGRLKPVPVKGRLTEQFE